jgi:hypothetical protein
MRQLLRLSLPLLLAIVFVTSGGIAFANTSVWSENWDSYPTGQDMHGVGGWKGWDNDSMCTAYTSNVTYLSSPNSIEIVGESDLVHEFAYDDGVWVITVQQFVPSSFNGTSFFIVMNEYADSGPYAWGTQVAFDSFSNNVSYLYPYLGDPLPLVKGQWVEIRVEIDLDADWQSIYYNGDLLHECDWTSLYPGSNTSIAAVDLCAANASSVYYDDLSIVEVLEISVDIKPQSCPNPINVNGKGVLPVAILGSEVFDVTEIDPASVRLEGVAPLTWAWEDAAEPGCSGPDGYLDLTLKFKTQEIVAALGEVYDGEVHSLELTGTLLDSTPIVGSDEVWLIEKGQAPS